MTTGKKTNAGQTWGAPIHIWVHLSDKDSDKSNGSQFIWPNFYWSILHCKDILNNYSSELIWKFFLLEWREWWFDDIILQFMAYYNSISITEHNQYLWIELKT